MLKWTAKIFLRSWTLQEGRLQLCATVYKNLKYCWIKTGGETSVWLCNSSIVLVVQQINSSALLHVCKLFCISSCFRWIIIPGIACCTVNVNIQQMCIEFDVSSEVSFTALIPLHYCLNRPDVNLCCVKSAMGQWCRLFLNCKTILKGIKNQIYLLYVSIFIGTFRTWKKMDDS